MTDNLSLVEVQIVVFDKTSREFLFLKITSLRGKKLSEFFLTIGIRGKCVCFGSFEVVFNIRTLKELKNATHLNIILSIDYNDIFPSRHIRSRSSTDSFSLLSVYYYYLRNVVELFSRCLFHCINFRVCLTLIPTQG